MEIDYIYFLESHMELEGRTPSIKIQFIPSIGASPLRTKKYIQNFLHITHMYDILFPIKKNARNPNIPTSPKSLK